MSTTTKPRNITATFEAVLWYADGPQVVLLRIDSNTFVIGVSVEAVRGKDEFFGGRISRNLLDSYLRNRCDLRYVLAYPDRRKNYIFEFEDGKSKVSLAAFSFVPNKHENLLPEHRLFASDHTEDYALDGFSFSHVQRYLVDGKWDVKEFSKFHGNLSDLYAFTRSIDTFEDENSSFDTKRKIVTSFQKPWQGGGSYLSFFKEISNSGGRASRPELEAIQWASPGYMDILGSKDSFERISSLLIYYDNNQMPIDEGYKKLYDFLLNGGFLRQKRSTFDRKSAEAEEINERAKNFCNLSKITSYRTLKKMSGNDPLVAAKVLLASVRRLTKMHQFFIEGRVAIEGEAIG